MKKSFSCLLFTLLSFVLFAESYKIADFNFDIQGAKGISFGKTSEIALLMKCPIDTNTVFESKEDLEEYINEYKQRLVNTRAFDTIEVDYKSEAGEESDINNVTLLFTLVDSSHLLALPYPKYDSNSGFNLKIKAKDTNFLGTLNPLATDIYINYNEVSEQWKTGVNFSYDFPFEAGIFNATWANSFNIDYLIEEESKPTFYTRTGVGFSLPKDFFSINFGTYITVNYNEKFSFDGQLNLSTPITLYKAKNYSSVNYSPYINFYYSWVPADETTGKSLSFGHSLSNSKVNWNNLFRKGYSLSLDNSYSYNLEKNNIAIPTVSFEGSFFYNFKIMDKSFLDRFGITSRLYAFTVIDVPYRNGSGNQWLGYRMRGILNNNFPSSPCGVVLNLDLPVNIITTHFSRNLFNFTMQFSPFIDLALTNDNKEETFNLNKFDYSTGMEVLVYPKRFSSYTIRGSVGFDLENAKNDKDGLMKGLWRNKEIYIGLDLHY